MANLYSPLLLLKVKYMKYYICELRLKNFTHEKAMAATEILKKNYS